MTTVFYVLFAVLVVAAGAYWWLFMKKKKGGEKNVDVMQDSPVPYTEPEADVEGTQAPSEPESENQENVDEPNSPSV